MGVPVLLFVGDDLKQAQLISRAIEELALPRPQYVSSGEAAVYWVMGRDCGACMLEYQLPGIDGMETLTPALPVIMMGGPDSEQIAVTAHSSLTSRSVPRVHPLEATTPGRCDLRRVYAVLDLAATPPQSTGVQERQGQPHLASS